MSNRPAPRWLKVEHLERRELLAVVLDGDILRITGTDSADTVTIDPFTQNGEQWVTATLNGVASPYEASSIRKIVFRGGGGDDSFVNNSDLRSYAKGNGGDDTLVGGSGKDRLYGGVGCDTLTGGAGNDRIFGGSSGDIIHGGAGNDSISGHGGVDELYGEDGDDRIKGGSGGDLILGGEGNDYIHGHTGNDEIYGGNGNDVILGRHADDMICAGAGNDRVYGGKQNDTIFGEGEKDYLAGGRGDDWISGGDERDKVYGGRGDDHLRGDDGNDRIRGSDGADAILGQAGADLIFGGDGNDTVRGGEGDDYLDGDAGADNLYGGSGLDQLFGDDGNDGLFGGGSAADYLTGGLGSDRFLTQSGDSIQDRDAIDAQLMFVDGSTKYTEIAKDWTDGFIEKMDKALTKLHEAAGSALIFKDTYTDLPVKMYLADVFSLGPKVAGFNWFNGFERQIHVRADLSSESFGATIVHEFGHNWDSSAEGNEDWNAFQLLEKQSSTNDDFARAYGQTNAKEDWATNWELHFGYYEWVAPESPSQLLQQKQAAVQDFFSSFASNVS